MHSEKPGTMAAAVSLRKLFVTLWSSADSAHTRLQVDMLLAVWARNTHQPTRCLRALARHSQTLHGELTAAYGATRPTVPSAPRQPVLEVGSHPHIALNKLTISPSIRRGLAHGPFGLCPTKPPVRGGTLDIQQRTTRRYLEQPGRHVAGSGKLGEYIAQYFERGVEPVLWITFCCRPEWKHPSGSVQRAD